MLETVDPAAD